MVCRIVKNAGWTQSLLLTLSAFAFCGCPTTPPPHVAESKATATSAITPVVGSSDKAVEKTSQPSAAATGQQSAPDVTPVALEPPPPPPESKERILLFAPGS